MTEDEARKQVVEYWLNKAEQAIASAKAEHGAKRFRGSDGALKSRVFPTPET